MNGFGRRLYFQGFSSGNHIKPKLIRMLYEYSTRIKRIPCHVIHMLFEEPPLFWRVAFFPVRVRSLDRHRSFLYETHSVTFRTDTGACPYIRMLSWSIRATTPGCSYVVFLVPFAVWGRRLRNGSRFRLSLRYFYTNRCAQSRCNPAQHAERVSLVGRRFQTTDLLLRSSHHLGEIFLRKPHFLPEGRNLERYVPGFSGRSEAGSKLGILQLLLKVLVKIRSPLHSLFPALHSSKERAQSKRYFTCLSDTVKLKDAKIKNTFLAFLMPARCSFV
jgi:hypothetical protein